MAIGVGKYDEDWSGAPISTGTKKVKIVENTEMTLSSIKHQYKILLELHGHSTSVESLKRTVAKDFNITVEEVEYALDITTVPNVREYGLINGRLQPPHYGHLHIINEVLLDGRIPIILLGDDDGANLDRNPLTYQQRKELIKLIYPNTEIIFYKLQDRDNWSDWFDDIGHLTVGNSGRHRDQITFYYNNKEEDRYDYFEVYGKEYFNEFYTKIFEDNGIRTQKVAFVERTDIKVDAHATNIRNDIETYKHLLDARIYWKLKEWGW